MYAPLQVQPFPKDTPSSYRWVVAAALASCCLHGGLYATFAHHAVAQDVPEDKAMVMEVDTTPPPEVKPPPPPPPEVKPPPHHTPIVKAPPVVHQEAPPPPPSQPPPPNPTPPTPIHIGVTLSSTTQAGAFAAPVGNSLGGKADTKAADPNQSRGYRAPVDFVPSYDVTESPKVDAEPDLQAYYPENARKQNEEGRVTLALTVDATGVVTQAKVLHGAGNGFDEAAVRAATEKLHFKPAKVNGKAVSTVITYTITFILD